MDALFGSSSNTTVDCTKPIADIPPEYCLLYVAAAPDCPGLDWTVLAAIGKVETDHGRSTLPGVSEGENYAGAGGPMQFLAPTFDGVIAAHQIPPGGATPTLPVQPARRHPRRGLPAVRQRSTPRRPAGGDLRLQPRRLVRRQGPRTGRQVRRGRRDQRRQRRLQRHPSPQRRHPGRDQLRLRTTRPALRVGRQRPRQRRAGFDCSGLTKPPTPPPE